MTSVGLFASAPVIAYNSSSLSAYTTLRCPTVDRAGTHRAGFGAGVQRKSGQLVDAVRSAGQPDQIGLGVPGGVWLRSPRCSRPTAAPDRRNPPTQRRTGGCRAPADRPATVTALVNIVRSVTCDHRPAGSPGAPPSGRSGHTGWAWNRETARCSAPPGMARCPVEIRISLWNRVHPDVLLPAGEVPPTNDRSP